MPYRQKSWPISWTSEYAFRAAVRFSRVWPTDSARTSSFASGLPKIPNLCRSGAAMVFDDFDGLGRYLVGLERGSTRHEK